MKTKFVIIIFALSICGAYSQSDSLGIKNNIDSIVTIVTSLERDINELKVSSDRALQEYNTIKKTQSELRKSFKQLSKDSETYRIQSNEINNTLRNTINNNKDSQVKSVEELNTKIETNKKSTTEGISDLSKNLNRNTLLWIIAILVVVICLLLVFFLLRNQIFKHKTDLEKTLQNTRKELEEEGVKMDSKLIELLETQFKILESTPINNPQEVDHTLALKVADEIIRIHKNLTQMDEKTKGLKQLIASVKRIQDNFASNGYELVEMLGQPYNEGMKVSANFIPDENLDEGQQIITRIIKPQVNFQGVMIQSAQIEVSQGE